MALYSDASAGYIDDTYCDIILIVERVICLLCICNRRIDYITITFLLHVCKRTSTQRSFH